MTLILTIENAESLPNSVPASIRMTGQARFTIGRSQGLDWSLPDQHRFISGKHCEIHMRAGTYWLYDVSTNGTFMNGEMTRIKSPQPLSNGDRVAIGIYVITVKVESEVTQVKHFPMASSHDISRGGAALQYQVA